MLLRAPQMRPKAMKEKKDIVENWLPRYTGTPLAEFGEYVLLTNFDNYVEWFATLHGGLVKGIDRPMPNVTADGITLINFGMGSPNAATVMDLLSAIAPKAVLFLGKCGGLKRKNQIGDLILPIAAIRGEGTSNDYLPPEVPALPAFELQRAVSTMIRDLGHDYGQVLCTRPIVVFGNTMIASGICCVVHEAWRSTWRLQQSLRQDLPTTFRLAHCFLCPISQ